MLMTTKALKMQERIEEELGFEEAWNSLCKSLSVDEMIDNFSHIMRAWDIPFEDEEE